APAAWPSATPASFSRCGSSASRPARRASTSMPGSVPRAHSLRADSTNIIRHGTATVAKPPAAAATEPSPEMLDVARVQTALAIHEEALALTPQRMVPGHRVVLLFGGAQAYPAMLDAIASA